MSNVDLSQLITAEAKAAQAAAVQLAGRKGECRDRIFAVVDATAQMNLAAAAAAGGLDDDQMQTYRAGLGWIAAMRAACAGGDDWPSVPAGVVELANQF